ncbi:hypothetical protein IWQ61_007850 [Dispira simplex]|nr:hypothetical protein IWQ61_007850 [Dispira simplex]
MFRLKSRLHLSKDKSPVVTAAIHTLSTEASPRLSVASLDRQGITPTVPKLSDPTSPLVLPQGYEHWTLLLQDFARRETQYVKELNYLCKTLNPLLRRLATTEAVVKGLCKTFTLLDELHAVYQKLYDQQQATDAHPLINPSVDGLVHLLDTVDVLYSEYCVYQYQTMFWIRMLKLQHITLQSTLNGRLVEQWYKAPVLHVLAYHALVKALLEAVQGKETQEPERVNILVQRLQSILDLAYDADQKVQQFEALVSFQCKLDTSQMRDFSTLRRVSGTVNLCGPEGLAIQRRFVRQDIFNDVDYRGSITEKSVKREVILVLLTDIVLMCAHVTVGKKRSTAVSPYEYVLLHPPFLLRDIQLVNTPNSLKGMGNLMELRVPNRDLILLQASDPAVKVEWLQYVETIQDPASAANHDGIVKGIAFPEATLSRATMRRRYTLTHRPGAASTRASFDTVRSTGADSAVSFAPSFIHGSLTSLSGAFPLASETGLPSTKAAMPPADLGTTQGLLKMRRLYVHVWRPNIENHLRWLNQGLVTLEVRQDAQDNPFAIIYPERPSPWDDSVGPFIASLWILATTSVKRQSPTRFFLQNRYCLEFPSEFDATKVLEFLTQLISCQQGRPPAFLAVADTLYSSPRCKVYVLKESGWQNLGGCIVEIRKTTAERNTISVLFEGSCREYLNEWILPSTRVHRANSTNTQLALFTTTGLVQLLLRQKTPDANLFYRIMLEQVAQGNVNPQGLACSDFELLETESSETIPTVSCYTSQSVDQEEVLVELESKLYVVHNQEWYSLGLGAIALHYLSTERCWRLLFTTDPLGTQLLPDNTRPRSHSLASTDKQTHPPQRDVIYNSLVLPQYITYYLEGTRVTVTTTVDYGEGSDVSTSGTPEGLTTTSKATVANDDDLTDTALMVQFKDTSLAQQFYQTLVTHLGEPRQPVSPCVINHPIAQSTQPLTTPNIQMAHHTLCEQFSRDMDLSA